MAINKGTINMLLTIGSTIGTFMAVDYSKYSTLFSHWNWYAIFVSLFVGGMIYAIFWYVGKIVKEGIQKTELIIKEGIQKEYENLKTSVKNDVIFELHEKMSKIVTTTIEQNETYKKLDDVFKKLDEAQDYWRNRQLTAYKIVRDLIVNKTFTDSEKHKQYIESMGKFFSDYLYTAKELEEFKLQKDILIEFKKIATIKELNKLENEKNNI